MLPCHVSPGEESLRDSPATAYSGSHYIEAQGFLSLSLPPSLRPSLSLPTPSQSRTQIQTRTPRHKSKRGKGTVWEMVQWSVYKPHHRRFGGGEAGHSGTHVTQHSYGKVGDGDRILSPKLGARLRDSLQIEGQGVTCGCPLTSTIVPWHNVPPVLK